MKEIKTKKKGLNPIKNTKNRTKATNQKYKKVEPTGQKHYYLQNMLGTRQIRIKSYINIDSINIKTIFISYNFP